MTLGRVLGKTSVACWGGAVFLALARIAIADPSAVEALTGLLVLAVLLGTSTALAGFGIRRMARSPRTPENPTARRTGLPVRLRRSPGFDRPLPPLPDLRPPRRSGGPGDAHTGAARMPIPRYERIDADGWLPRRVVRERRRRFPDAASA